MKNKVACALAYLLAVFPLSGCDINDGPNMESFLLPEWETQYTVEEHEQRIRQKTQEIFEEQIANGEIVNYQVEILYAFYDNAPEFFLVQLEYSYERPVKGKDENGNDTWHDTKYSHLIGCTVSDKYYLLNAYYAVGYDAETWFMPGRNMYEVCGYQNEKKYFGTYDVQAVEVDGRMIELVGKDCYQNGDCTALEFHAHGNGTTCSCGNEIPQSSFQFYHDANFRYDYYFNRLEYDKSTQYR